MLLQIFAEVRELRKAANGVVSKYGGIEAVKSVVWVADSLAAGGVERARRRRRGRKKKEEEEERKHAMMDCFGFYII